MNHIDIDPAFASTEYPRLIEAVKKSLMQLQMQADEAEAMLASDLADDPIIVTTAEVSLENTRRSIRVQQFQLAGYETRLNALKKAVNGKEPKA